MAETVCACLGLKVSDHEARISSALPYKTLNAAYPRKTVNAEVAKLLYLHGGKITGLDGAAVRMLMSSDDLGERGKGPVESCRNQVAEDAMWADCSSDSSSRVLITGSSPVAPSHGRRPTTNPSQMARRTQKPAISPINSRKCHLRSVPSSSASVSRCSSRNLKIDDGTPAGRVAANHLETCRATRPLDAQGPVSRHQGCRSHTL